VLQCRAFKLCDPDTPAREKPPSHRSGWRGQWGVRGGDAPLLVRRQPPRRGRRARRSRSRRDKKRPTDARRGANQKEVEKDIMVPFS